VGVSERTSMEAAHQVITVLFKKELVHKISVVKIPRKRDYMHIDTLFTQVNRNTWVLLGAFSKATIRQEAADPVQRILDSPKKDDSLRIIQFHKNNMTKPLYIDNLEDLLTDISMNDLKCNDKVQFIYSGNNRFPYDSREQWTDSCNLLALKEGVVLGYDRNDKTTDAFREHGFKITEAKDLIEALEKEATTPDKIKNTLVLIPSAELSRARGGFHCMSMPLMRDDIEDEV
jgi:arginine deiminase